MANAEEINLVRTKSYLKFFSVLILDLTDFYCCDRSYIIYDLMVMGITNKRNIGPI